MSRHRREGQGPSDGGHDLGGRVGTLSPGKRTLTAFAPSDPPPLAPGRRTLTQHMVQRRTDGSSMGNGAPQDVAERGVAGASEPLPFHDRIQASFGRHDVSHVRAVTGGVASEAAAGLGANAFAIGDRVGFARSPDLHTAAHEAAHVVQQRSGVQLQGGIDGGASDPHEHHADAVADKVVRGESAESLLDPYARGGGFDGIASILQRKQVQRDAIDRIKGAATQAVVHKEESRPRPPVDLRPQLERYLGHYFRRVQDAIQNQLDSIVIPDPHPRLTWTDTKPFVDRLYAKLKMYLDDFSPLTKLDEIVHPSDVSQTLGAELPATDVWWSPIGLAIAQAIQLAMVESLHRLGPRYLDVADAAGMVGEGMIRPNQLVGSKPIDRHVIAAMCEPHVLTIEPRDPTITSKPRPKRTGLRKIKSLDWQPRPLWNWVRVTDPADATAEELAATLWTDIEGGDIHAYELVAAPPLFGVPPKVAIQQPNAKPPPKALAQRHDANAELGHVASSGAADDIALHQSPVGAPGKPDAAAVVKHLDDSELQLQFVAEEASR